MLWTVLPIFSVILAGWLFGRGRKGAEGDALLNDYALYVALPALLFVALARAERADLGQWAFVCATLAGIAVAYGAGLALARRAGIAAPASSIVAMGACYGTTGYLGVPVLMAAYGSDAALPAALATVLHNIPVIVAVILRHEIAGGSWQAGLRRALRVAVRNPLLLAVAAGLAVTLAVAWCLGLREGLWLAVAVVMAAPGLMCLPGSTALPPSAWRWG